MHEKIVPQLIKGLLLVLVILLILVFIWLIFLNYSQYTAYTNCKSSGIVTSSLVDYSEACKYWLSPFVTVLTLADILAGAVAVYFYRKLKST